MFLYVETREIKEKTIADLASLVKSQEGELYNINPQVQCRSILRDMFMINCFLIYIKLLR